MAKILVQGHGSLRLTTDSGKVIYIDPFIGEGYDVPGDLILVTHQHHDHIQFQKIVNGDTCKKIQNMDAHPAPDVYNSFDEADIHIEAVQAYNRNHPVDECVGYLITADGSLIYVAGDTGLTEDMKKLSERNIDIAFYPTDSIYNMTPEEATEAANIVGAKLSVPYHSQPDHLYSKDNLYSEEAFMKFTPDRVLRAYPGQVVEL